MEFEGPVSEKWGKLEPHDRYKTKQRPKVKPTTTPYRGKSERKSVGAEKKKSLLGCGEGSPVVLR